MYRILLICFALLLMMQTGLASNVSERRPEITLINQKKSHIMRRHRDVCNPCRSAMMCCRCAGGDWNGHVCF